MTIINSPTINCITHLLSQFVAVTQYIRLISVVNGFHQQLTVLPIYYPNLLQLLNILDLLVSLTVFPVCGILFRFSRKNEIHKEYLGTGY